MTPGITLLRGPEVQSRFVEVAALDRIAWGETEPPPFLADGEHAWRVWSEHNTVIAAEASHQIIGALCAFETLDPRLHFLHKVFVHPRQRGRGIGALLLASYVAVLDDRGLDSIMTTAPENVAMQSVARRHGFMTERLVKGYYRADEDRLLMRRSVVS